MSNPFFIKRKRSRHYALQALYEWNQSQSEVHHIHKNYLKVHAPEKFDVVYFENILHGVTRDVETIDSLLKPYLALVRQTEIDPIELSILRLATFEFRHCLDVPYRVVIEEAVQLAVKFGGPDSSKFINKLLDELSKELRQQEREHV